MDVLDFTLRVLLSLWVMLWTNTILPKIRGTFHVFKERYFRNSGLNVILIMKIKRQVYLPSDCRQELCQQSDRLHWRYHILKKAFFLFVQAHSIFHLSFGLFSAYKGELNN